MCRCDASCLACVGPGKGNCSECVDGHTLLDGVCVLSHNCVDGKLYSVQPVNIKQSCCNISDIIVIYVCV